MANEVKLPRLGQGMESGTIVKWLKSEGERVEKGEPLYELDTDKVTQEVEAEASGVLLKIAVQEGEVPVGETIAVIGEEGEETPDLSSGSNGSAAQVDEDTKKEGSAAQEVDEDSKEEGSAAPAREEERERGREASSDAREQIAEARQPEPTRDGGRVKASPLARRIARERGIDLASVSGTGPEGRIVAEDVERAEVGHAPVAAQASAAQPSGEIERRELTSIRKTIARRLIEAWQIPAFQLQVSIDMTRTDALVASLREHDEGPKTTVTDVLTRVCAAALMRHREVNARYTDDAILLLPTANVGIAVAAPQGLVVPVIHGAERLRLAEIAAARADIVARAREGKLQPADLEDGTFTISNLGMYRVERFTAVLNPPQAAIVAVGATEDRAVAVDGQLAVRPTMIVTGTFDHRAVDGAPAADFLQTVKELLEEPGLML
ncbi:MAG TPA: dihydrolipoamide acetyltransferase family protein [Gaiellaceae bacterium]|nr:dihydrolipoamide acetyltransferase family protein [Gaiellaceae bacterium]